MRDPFNEAEDEKKVLTAGEDAAGRLDAWLAGALAGTLSRSRVKALIDEGHVTIDGRPATGAREAIRPGMAITLILPPAVDPLPKGEAIPLEILHEDADLIVLVKPAGLVVHPGAGNPTGTLVNALIEHCGDTLSGIGGVKRPGIVHRLDKDTSGVMVVAKTDLAHRGLAAQFADHGRSGHLQRAYHAFVWGRPKRRNGSIDAPLGRSRDRVRRAVRPAEAADAREARTHFSTRAIYGENSDGTAAASLLECRLETGRTHQIRVHMAHAGTPLIGDREYGAGFRTKANTLPDETRTAVEALDRQALHAHLLGFEHPATGREMVFEAGEPDDLRTLRKGLEAL
ncbi:RluA family pseudouridine synthase [Pararhizobium mangrovi]|uniref:Pseudouridine synthase n=1 Tax=Pararhizobium mangrovi TaxID=2590452 RepID=A0A506UHC7_9HYPH|nr:RluA family pseudouridine synthase [Pararhizobium mangrovi]TPW32717.1 RluA family pseudouridine synthase [Pararhizobium mangrovi]